MAEQRECQCQSAAHGHRPGKCPHPAVDDGLCKECNEETRAAEANPMGRASPHQAGRSAHEAAITNPAKGNALPRDLL